MSIEADRRGPVAVTVPLARSSTDRIAGGVAAGIGERLRVDPAVVRVAFGVLSLAAGAGAFLYLALWALLPEAPPGRAVPPRRAGFRPVAGIACITAGLLIVAREAGWWFGDAFVWPAALAGLGSVLIWGRADGSGISRLDVVTRRVAADPIETIVGRDESRGRLLIGVLLVAAGVAAFLAANFNFAAARTALLPVLVVMAGFVLVFGPWLWRLGTQLASERRERIRSEERSEMAAHLHDSVLQTLALIQRTDSPRRMATLARVQERELRSWLLAAPGGDDSLATAVEGAAGRIEALHEVKVDAVVVGDAALDDRLRALIGACGEAMNNAAKHADAEELRVYVEVGEEAVDAFVRDEGCGFDPAAVSSDRRGITASIVERMARHGGKTEITSHPGAGTEVHILLPRRSA